MSTETEVDGGRGWFVMVTVVLLCLDAWGTTLMETRCIGQLQSPKRFAR